ncbi:putative membrane protein (DUF2339) [Parelusimicrobium proximum]|uniref:DUF2339 domain-containing protein n=1 Tax=Parelusimicrobium proximum TaxID=3228953 RepID=UPI003D16921B
MEFIAILFFIILLPVCVIFFIHYIFLCSDVYSLKREMRALKEKLGLTPQAQAPVHVKPEQPAPAETHSMEAAIPAVSAEPDVPQNPEPAVQEMPSSEPAYAQEEPKEEPAPAATSKEKAPVVDFEMFAGKKLLAWLGGFLLFLGMVFLVKYTIENNLISLEVRLMLAALAGIACVAAGVLIRQEKLSTLSHSLAGAGIAILYAVTYASFSFYGFISSGVAFGLMIFISALGLYLSVHMKAFALAVLAVIGAYMTPPLLSTGTDRVVELFTYITIVSVTVLFMAVKRGWNSIFIMSGIGTGIITIGWFAKYGYYYGDFTFCVIALVLSAVFYVMCEYARKNGSERSLFWYTFSLLTVLFMSLLIFALPNSDCTAVIRLTSLILGAGIILSLKRINNATAYMVMPLCLMAMLIYPSRDPMWYLPLVPLFMLLTTTMHAFASDKREGHFGHGVYLALLTAVPFVMISLLPNTAWEIVLMCFTVCAVAAFNSWRFKELEYSNSVAAIVVFGVLYEHLGRVSMMWQILSVTLFVVFFTKIPFILKTRFEESKKVWLSPVLAGLAGCWMLYCLLGDYHMSKYYMSLLPFSFALYYGAGLACIYFKPSGGEEMQRVRTGYFLFAVLAFLTAVFPILFSRHELSLALAMEGAVLALLGAKLNYKQFNKWSFYLLVFVFLKSLFSINEMFRYDGTNWYAWVYPVIIASYALAVYIWKGKEGETYLGMSPKSVFAFMGTVFAFVFLNQEISYFFGSNSGRYLSLYVTESYMTACIYFLSWTGFGTALTFIGAAAKSAKMKTCGAVIFMTGAVISLISVPTAFDVAVRTAVANVLWLPYIILSAMALLTLMRCGKAWAMWCKLVVVLSTFIAVNVQIANAFSIDFIAFNPAGTNFSESLAYTLCWGLFAAGMLVWGIYKSSATVRKSALALFFVTLLKLFFIDLWQLGNLYRALAFIGIALIAIFASFAYQKYMKDSGGSEPE